MEVIRPTPSSDDDEWDDEETSSSSFTTVKTGGCKKVTFSDHVTVIEISPVEHSYDYSMLDMQRFKRRIEQIHIILKPVLYKKYNIYMCGKQNSNKL